MNLLFCISDKNKVKIWYFRMSLLVVLGRCCLGMLRLQLSDGDLLFVQLEIKRTLVLIPVIRIKNLQFSSSLIENKTNNVMKN